MGGVLISSLHVSAILCASAVYTFTASFYRRGAEDRRDTQREIKTLSSFGKRCVTDCGPKIALWTDVAVVPAPGLPPITGKSALREYVEGSFRIPGFKINWTISAASISPDGKLAYLFGDNTVTMDDPDGQSTTIAGRAVTI